MTRETLPNRRYHEGFEFSCWGQTIHAGMGRNPEGGPWLEVWINSGKSGTAAETYARDAAVLISLGLQYGVPIEAMQKAVMREMNGGPSGPVGIIVDRIARQPRGGEAAPVLPDPITPRPTDHPEFADV